MKRKSLSDKRKEYLDAHNAVSVWEFADKTGYSIQYIYKLCLRGKFGAKSDLGMWAIPKKTLERVLTEIRPGGVPQVHTEENRTRITVSCEVKP